VEQKLPSHTTTACHNIYAYTAEQNGMRDTSIQEEREVPIDTTKSTTPLFR